MTFVLLSPALHSRRTIKLGDGTQLYKAIGDKREGGPQHSEPGSRKENGATAVPMPLVGIGTAQNVGENDEPRGCPKAGRPQEPSQGGPPDTRAIGFVIFADILCFTHTHKRHGDSVSPIFLARAKLRMLRTSLPRISNCLAQLCAVPSFDRSSFFQRRRP